MIFRKYDRVSHTRFGPGVVIDIDARYSIIEFDDAGTRKFVSALVQLERCELPLPVKPAPVRRRRRNATAGDSVVAKTGPDRTSASQKRHHHRDETQQSQKNQQSSDPVLRGSRLG